MQVQITKKVVKEIGKMQDNVKYSLQKHFTGHRKASFCYFSTLIENNYQSILTQYLCKKILLAYTAPHCFTIFVKRFYAIQYTQKDIISKNKNNLENIKQNPVEGGTAQQIAIENVFRSPEQG